MDKIKSYIKLMRTYQWVKNLFVFLPVFFAFRMTESDLLILCGWAFLGVSFIASSIYIINDWCDIESDKLHPEKRHRPLASGAVTKGEASVILAFLLIVGFSIYVLVLNNLAATALLATYFVMNLCYSFKLKHVPILDISIVATGFVMRIFLGGLATDIPLSRWIVIMTFLLALFLALGKRRDDLLILDRTGDKTRKNLDGYNLGFVDASLIMMSGIIIVAYIMYTISPEIIERNGEYLYLTSLFVLLGILRYLQILFVDERSGNPTKIFLKDRFLHFIMLGWVMSFFIISYFFNDLSRATI